ncbi:outer membrane lipoprotein carrier protein LolA [Rickettsiales bacterium LUAb2]
MIKKIILLSTIVLCFMAKPVFSIENKDMQIIKKINTNLQKYNTLKSQFKQTDDTGNVSYGWFVFAKTSDKARIEYNKTPIRIIINNSSIMLEQIDLQEKSFTPLATSPFKYIISKSSSLTSDQLEITNFIKNDQQYLVTVTPKDNSNMGYITFKFDKKSLKLMGWVITDSANTSTVIDLINPQFNNKNIPNYIFNTHKVRNINYKDI